MGFFDYLSTSVGYILAFIVVMTIIIIWATRKESMSNPRVSRHMKQVGKGGVRRAGVYV